MLGFSFCFYVSSIVASLAGLELASIALCVFGCIAAVTYYRINSTQRSIFDISSVFHLSLFIYSISIPLSFKLLYGYIDPEIAQAFQMCLIALISFTACSQIFASKSRRFDFSSDKLYLNLNKIHISETQYNIYMKFGIVSIAFYTIAFLVTIQVTTGIGAYLSAGYAGRSLIKMELGPVELSLYFVIIGLIFCLSTEFVRWKSSVAKIGTKILWIIVAIAIFVAFSTALGIRRPSFFLIFSAIAAYEILYKRISSAVLGIATSFLGFVFATFSLYRQILTDQGIDQTVNFLRSEFRNRVQEVFQGELGAPFRTLVHSHNEVNYLGYRFGKTYVDAFLNLTPSGLGVREISLSEQYTINYFGSEFIAIGGNMGFFPVTEAYLNFGIFGIAIVFGVFGTLAVKMDDFFFIKRDLLYIQILKICTLPWCFFFMRLDFSSFMKGYLYILIPTMLAFWVFSLASQHQNRNALPRVRRRA